MEKNVTDARIDQIAATSALHRAEGISYSPPKSFYELTLLFSRAEMGDDAKAAKYYQIVQHYTFPAAKWISGDEEVKKRLKDMKIDVPEGDLGPKDVVNIGMAIEEHLFQKMRFDRAMQNVEFNAALINYAFNPNEDYEKQVLKLHDEFLAMRRYRK